MKKIDFGEKITQFMSGRYGMDQLNKSLIGIAFILIILETFITSQVLNVTGVMVMFYTIYRTYSRDLSKRARENEKFMKLVKPVRRSFSLLKLRIREGRTHRFRTCPNCKVVIRTSKKRGTRILVCPRCKTKFKTHIYL
ncbi:TFIIB-type zinc ribbon-containing protein [Sediminispirochaeta smaragdinae]|uniref:Zn-finger containing protein n=1 Tax=Sediminispirochaeta smaragdinae (strain DSM 11293 / JCM 15392 / SEBR 4228) TaxID=573413 RepID=E1R345_SEDSS|nr:zf-TFIIB domain-containing protein [Sediminispirochaeta smaragdinae]ADK81231.1 Zn-finger containing protein [Sediminispirochaeta smaragdinae DSM 11293]